MQNLKTILIREKLQKIKTDIPFLVIQNYQNSLKPLFSNNSQIDLNFENWDTSPILLGFNGQACIWLMAFFFLLQKKNSLICPLCRLTTIDNNRFSFRVTPDNLKKTQIYFKSTLKYLSIDLLIPILRTGHFGGGLWSLQVYTCSLGLFK